MKRIGIEACFRCGLKDILISNNVQKLCKMCFCECRSRCHVIFDQLSSFKCVGFGAFQGCVKLTDISIPDGVEELCKRFFYGCKVLSHVVFSDSSLLKR